jgi:hypothetical protein
MLTGDPPYSGSTDMATALAHLNDRIPKLSTRIRALPPGLDRLVTDLLAKEPDKRVPSAAALRGRLDALGSVPTAGARGSRSAPRLPISSARARVDEAAARAGAGSVDGDLEETSVLGGHTSAISANGSGPSTGGGRVESRRREAQDLHDGTLAFRGSGPPTDPFGPNEPSPARRRTQHTGRNVGIVVASLVAIGAITAAAVLAGSTGRRPPTSPGVSTPASAVPKVDNVVVFMTSDRTPDNPTMTRYTFDGDPSTYWPTDQYSSPTFGNLYPGIGLAIHLDSAEQGRQLVVTSPTSGWSAQTYVASSDVPSGHPVADWGTPTDTKSDISSSTVTFNLGPRHAQWVLLWITNLGPADTARVAELSVG